jgi:hypothetical protein
MSRTLMVASRELRERTRVFLMAAAMAILPFATALAPAARGNRPMIIAGVAFGAAIMLTTGLAVALGASTVAGDLASRRMSFYFSKPLSPWSIWFGKVIAALASIAICFAIIVTPAFLVTGSEWKRSFAGTNALLLVAGIAAVLFFVTHALSTMVRSRSALIGVDFVMAAFSAGATFLIVRPLLIGGSTLAFTVLRIIAITILGILVFAPIWQLAIGRTDIRRSHAALSRAIWVPIAILLIAFGAYAAWVVHVDPSDLKTIETVLQAPGGNSVFLSGNARGRGDYRASFLIDPNSGRHERIASLPWWGVEYSEDGKVVAYLQPTLRMADAELYTKRVDVPNAPPVATGIRKAGSAFAISPDGSRIAVLNDETISLYDATGHRVIASARREYRATTHAAFFLGPDVVRVYQSPRGSRQVDIFELDARTKSFVKTGSLQSNSPYGGIRLSHDATRLLVPRTGAVADARTGAMIAQLPVTTSSSFAAAILTDGTVAVMKREQPKGTDLFLFAPDGTQKSGLIVPTRFCWISGETDSGKLIVIGYDRVMDAGDSGRGRTMFVIDPHRGVIERALKDLKGPVPTWGDPRAHVFRANEKLTAMNADGDLVTWNAATGEVTALK